MDDTIDQIRSINIFSNLADKNSEFLISYHNCSDGFATISRIKYLFATEDEKIDEDAIDYNNETEKKEYVGSNGSTHEYIWWSSDFNEDLKIIRRSEEEKFEFSKI